ncbi:MAG: hypothetical protein EXS06_13135 [Planctomycetaceae bacterium]|nr:hypothetical protein [Planctomycetaceae bacterium]
MADAITILLLSPDLMVSSRIAGLAATIPATILTLASQAAAPRGGPFAVIVVDLQVNGQSATALLERAKGFRASQSAAGAERAAIIAFGPHVAVDRLAEAAAAGADLVVSRGELLGALPAVVERVRSAVQKGNADGSG